MALQGKKLQELREERNISLNTIAEKSRISIRYLRYLENDELDKMPGEVYTLGFVKSYLKAIDYYDEDIIASYKAYYHNDDEVKMDQTANTNLDTNHVQTVTIKKVNSRKPSSHATRQTPEPMTTRQNSFGSKKIWIVLLAVIFVAALIIYMVSNNNDTPNQNQPEVIPPVPPVVEPIEPEPVEPIVPVEPEIKGINLIVEAVNGRSWMGIWVDGEYSETTINSGEKLEFHGENDIKIRYGNAGAVKVTKNGEDLGIVGDAGKVVTIEYNLEEKEAEKTEN